MAFVPVAAAGTVTLGSDRAGFASNSLRRPKDLRCYSRRLHRAVVTAGPPRKVNAEELETILKGEPGPVIVDAFAKWCGPCQFLIPELDVVAERMGDRIQILKLDTDEEPEYASAIGVRGLPTLFFIQDGQLKHRMEGALTASDLTELAEHFFFNGPVPSFANPEMPKA